MRQETIESGAALLTFATHEDVHCFGCTLAIPGGTYQATDVLGYKWRKECPSCGAVTYYNVSSEDRK